MNPTCFYYDHNGCLLSVGNNNDNNIKKIKTLFYACINDNVILLMFMYQFY